MIPKISFRHLDPKDLDCLYLFVKNKNVTKFLTWQAYSSKKETLKYLNIVSQKTNFPDETLGIIYKNILIGTVHLIYRNNHDVQIGFGINEEFWNQKIGTYTVSKIIEYIKNSDWSKNVKTILADVNQKNIYAIKILKKNYFVLFKKDIEKFRDRYLYQL